MLILHCSFVVVIHVINDKTVIKETVFLMCYLGNENSEPVSHNLNLCCSKERMTIQGHLHLSIRFID